LQGQPWQVFAILLQESGKVVTREELRQKVWPGDTFVDFDHGLNTAITKIRTALGDSADSPRFVETLPRLGYRFLAPVESLTAPKLSSVPLITRLLSTWLFRSLVAMGKGPLLVVGITAILITGIIVGYLARIHSQSNPSSRVTRAVVKLEPGHRLYGIRQPITMALSSDGSFIIYSAIRENPEPQDKPQLYLRRTDQLEAKPIPGTEGGIMPFLSPDNRWVGFWADDKLVKVSLDGGVPVILCAHLGSPLGASWGPDNKIVVGFGRFASEYLYIVSADGGTPEILTPDKEFSLWSAKTPFGSFSTQCNAL
jgi:hypothetical protein